MTPKLYKEVQELAKVNLRPFQSGRAAHPQRHGVTCVTDCDRPHAVALDGLCWSSPRETEGQSALRVASLFVAPRNSPLLLLQPSSRRLTIKAGTSHHPALSAVWWVDPPPLRPASLRTVPHQRRIAPLSHRSRSTNTRSAPKQHRPA